MKIKIQYLGLVFIFIVGCSSALPDIQTPVTANEENVAPSPTPTLIQTEESLQTEMPASPAVTLTPTFETPLCVSPKDHEELETAVFEETPNLILEYLNSGATEKELERALFEQGILYPNSSAIVQDFTGDAKNDLMITIIDKTSVTIPPGGALLVFTCQGEQYGLTHIEQSGDLFGAPNIVHVQDMNLDGLTDIIYSSSKCGAHTCFEDTQILSWTGFAFEHKLEGSTSELPSPNVQITDYDQDGVYDFEVISGGYGSVGAGPQRSITSVWQYDPESGMWAFIQETTGASNYRIHIVHDADEAMRRGEYQVAQLLYDQILTNPDLLDWQNPNLEQLNLGAYIRYKIVVSLTLQGDVEGARNYLNSVKNGYSSFSSQYAYMEMAELFLDTYESSGMDKACEASIVFSAENSPAILSPLGQGVYGYSNPDYTPFDICP